MPFETDNWKSDDVSRALPHALGPEKSILSSMLQDPRDWIPVAIEEGITPDHFYLPSHSTLFEVLIERFSTGKEIELVSLVQLLLDTGRLDRVGGPSTLTDLMTYAPSPAYFRHHLGELKKKLIGRSIIQLSTASIASVYDSPDEIDETLEDMERKVMAIRDMGAVEKSASIKQSVGIVLDKFESELRHDPKAKGLMTGFEDLDRMTNGLKPGEMFVLAARPSVGKTAFMMNIVEHVCVDNGTPSLVFSAEMSHEAITKRLVFSRAKFALSDLSRGYTPNNGDLQRIKRASLEVANSKLYADDTSGPSINYIRAKSRRMVREHGIKFIAIDYLQLCKSTSKQAQFSREREIAEISAGIKGLAKDLGIPILILAQLSRKVEDRTGRDGKKARARMSDLRESGSIEQDADYVAFLSREDYQEGSESENSGIASCDLAKNRNGATGIIPLTFVADLMRFETGAPYVESSQKSDSGGRWANRGTD